MPSQLKSLAQLFNERVFRIPDYQRGYSWTKPQLEDFWQDMMRLTDGRNHYTGLITLERVSEDRWKNWNRDEDTWLISDANCTPFYVVDGQQRLTTAVILIKCLLDLVQGDNSELARTAEASTHRKVSAAQVAGLAVPSFSATRRTTRGMSF